MRFDARLARLDAIASLVPARGCTCSEGAGLSVRMFGDSKSPRFTAPPADGILRIAERECPAHGIVNRPLVSNLTGWPVVFERVAEDA